MTVQSAALLEKQMTYLQTQSETLIREYDQGWQKVSQASYVPGAGNSKAAIAGVMADLEKRIDTHTSSDMHRKVMSGEKRFEWWVDYAKVLHDSIVYNTGLSSGWSTWSGLKETVSETAKTVKDTAVTIGKNLPSKNMLTIWLVLIAIIVVFMTVRKIVA